MEKIYLGDGVYASMEDSAIKLSVDRLDDNGETTEEHYIYLEMFIYEQLQAYASRAWGIQAGIPGKSEGGA